MGEAAPHGLQIERVDWLDSGGRSGLLRVHGRGTAPEPLPELVIPTPEGQERHASLPDPRSKREPGTWRGAYVVHSDVVAAAGSAMQLELGTGVRLRIPAPTLTRPAPPRRLAPPPPEEEPSGGEVVDRAVLAERRARRAEAAEQAQARIAREALRAVEILELRAAELEQRLEAREAERPGTPAPAPAAARSDEGLRARLRELEHELAEARERATPAPPAPGEDERRVERLRSALSSAIVTIGDLRLALSEARVRRRLADVERGADGVRLAVLASERASVDAELAALRTRLAEAESREAQLRADADRAASRAAEAEAAHRQTLRRLEERSGELERARGRVAALEAELAAARAEAERVAGELPEAVSRAVARREEELRAAHAEAAELAGEELATVRSQLERLQEELVVAETARQLAEAAAAAAAAERQAAEVAWAARAEELAAAAQPAPVEPAAPEPPPAPEPAPAPVDAAALARKARGLAPAPPEPGTGEHLVAGLDAAAAALRRSAGTAPGRSLRRVLVEFAREDPAAAARVLVGLLPAQWRAVPAPVEYDLTIAGAGTFAVSVREASAAIVEVRRPRRRAEFHLRADAVALAEMLAGLRPAPGRLGRVRAAGRRRRLAEVLAALQESRLGLEEALGAGATVDPVLALRMLGHAVEPAWTRGRSFRIAHTFTDSGQTLLVVASDAGGLLVGPADEGDVDATVAMSQAAFAALLRGEAPSERPTVRGDHQAVEQLREWADRARRGGA